MKQKTINQIIQCYERRTFAPTVDEKWIYGCWKHYQKSIAMSTTNKEELNKWWEGCNNAYTKIRNK
jgi:hypothetical protein